MFIPNLRFTYKQRIGNTAYGQPRFGPERKGYCGVVRMEEQSRTTSVRTDSSASQTTAMEEVATARLLVPAYITLRQGDHVTVSGFNLVVQAVHARYSVLGVLDHWQVDLTIFRG